LVLPLQLALQLQVRLQLRLQVPNIFKCLCKDQDRVTVPRLLRWRAGARGKVVADISKCQTDQESYRNLKP